MDSLPLWIRVHRNTILSEWGSSLFLDNGKEYPASPSSLRGLRPTLLHVVVTTPYSHNEFKAYNIDIKSQSVN